jgi:CrcB protein
MHRLAWIFIGSGLGGVFRYLVDGWVQRLVNGSFPLGTLAVNVTGCLLIGMLSAALSGRVLIREEYRIGLLIGLLGGFTTFSTFGLETFAFASDGQHVRAALNVVLSVALGLAAVWGGYRLAEHWLGV